MPRRNICIPCHNKTKCKALPQDHVKGLNKGTCRYCRQHRIMVVSCAAKIENIIPSNDTGE